MTRLIKSPVTTYVPGNPGSAGSPYVPAQPARSVWEPVTTCAYSYPTDYIQQEDGSYIALPGSSSFVCTVENVLVYYPATLAVAAVPYAPPTAAQVVVSLNQGWNSYARTVGELLPGAYIEYTVKYGSYAALLAVGRPGMEGVALESFPYGIMVDTSGIYSFEAGEAVALATGNTPGLLIRIVRLADGRISYSIGGETARISEVGTYDVNEELYVYGLLYSGYDEVTTSEFKTGNLVSDASVTMFGSGTLTALPLPLVAMTGAGELLVAFDTAVVMNGYGALTAEFSRNAAFLDVVMSGSGSLAATLEGGGYGSITLAALQFLASDAASEYLGFGSTDLPLFAVTGTEATFIPAVPTSGYFNLPFLTVWGDGSETEIGTGGASLPEYQFIASEGEYGIGSFSLPLFYAGGYGEFMDDDEIILFSTGLARSQQANAIDLVMILNSAGELSSSLTLTREQVLELMSVLQQSDSFAMLGVYGYSMLSDLMAVSLQNAGIGSLPDLDDSSAVWVVNIDTQASSQYESYGFNSFLTRAGVAYGVAPDGVYRLEGATDAGAQIDALANLGKTDMATTLQKLLPNAYLGASSTGKLKLEVDADGSVYVYEARSSEDGTFKQHRVDLGRGLKANMLGLTVKNKNGADFKLATVDLLQAPGGRRI